MNSINDELKRKLYFANLKVPFGQSLSKIVTTYIPGIRPLIGTSFVVIFEASGEDVVFMTGLI